MKGDSMTNENDQCEHEHFDNIVNIGRPKPNELEVELFLTCRKCGRKWGIGGLPMAPVDANLTQHGSQILGVKLEQ